MRGKTETAAIFRTVVEIYESDFDLYRPSHSNKLQICSEVVSTNVSRNNSKNVSHSNSKRIKVGFQNLKFKCKTGVRAPSSVNLKTFPSGLTAKTISCVDFKIWTKFQKFFSTTSIILLMVLYQPCVKTDLTILKTCTITKKNIISSRLKIMKSTLLMI